MSSQFHLEKIGESFDVFDENGVSGFGILALTNQQVEYHFNKEDISAEQAEAYISNVLNRLPEQSIDELCHLACRWKNDKMRSDSMDYPDGLAEVKGRDILKHMGVGDVELYRNPHDADDAMLGAVLGGGTDWDLENGMEIVIKGDKVLSVAEAEGFGESILWYWDDEKLDYHCGDARYGESL